MSGLFGANLQLRFGGREEEVLSHPTRRLHVFTSRGRLLLGREGRVRCTMHSTESFAKPVFRRAGRSRFTRMMRVYAHDVGVLGP